MTDRLDELRARARKARGVAARSNTKDQRALKHKQRTLDNIDDTDLFGSYGLTGRQYAFVVEYVQDPSSGSAAARRAGYSANRSAVQAANMMKDTNVRAAIEDLRKRLLDNVEVTAEQIIKRLAEIGFNTHPKPSAGDQIKALELLSKWLGIDTQDSAGEVKITVSFDDSHSNIVDIEDAEIVSEDIDIVEVDQ